MYFQEFIQSDGLDIRIIIVGEYIFGYYRKTLEGEFRALGMNLKEKRELPRETISLAKKVYESIDSPLLAIDMVLDLDDNYYNIEYSPYY